jgi:hypothetical protein
MRPRRTVDKENGSVLLPTYARSAYPASLASLIVSPRITPHTVVRFPKLAIFGFPVSELLTCVIDDQNLAMFV